MIKTIQAHTKEYADAAKSEEAQEICLKGAKRSCDDRI